jgi:hypothetical protein
VWRHGGPSNSTLTNLENGTTDRISPASLRKLDLGLRWTKGSAERVLNGGEPELLDDTVTEPVPWRGDEHLANNAANGIREALSDQYLGQISRELGPDAASNPAVIRELRGLLEDRELASLADRIAQLPKDLQLKVSAYVDTLALQHGHEEIPEAGFRHPFPESFPPNRGD